MLTDQEINHQIATQVNGWTHLESIYYQNGEGSICYLADYCNSLPHAMDLAFTNDIALKPTPDGWQAYKLHGDLVTSDDPLASKAICLCLIETTKATEVI
jgi:hypothetical protein